MCRRAVKEMRLLSALLRCRMCRWILHPVRDSARSEAPTYPSRANPFRICRCCVCTAAAAGDLERAAVDAQHGFRLNGICAGCEVERTAGDINIPLIGFFRIVGLNGVCTGCDSKRTSVILTQSLPYRPPPFSALMAY